MRRSVYPKRHDLSIFSDLQSISEKRAKGAVLIVSFESPSVNKHDYELIIGADDEHYYVTPKSKYLNNAGPCKFPELKMVNEF